MTNKRISTITSEDIVNFAIALMEGLGLGPVKLTVDDSKVPDNYFAYAVEACDGERAIYLRSDMKADINLLIAIAHELRHFWQIDNNWSFDDHKDRSEIDSDEYNNQEAELDANAFAVWAIDTWFHITPIGGATDTKAVRKRVDEIRQEWKVVDGK